MEEPIYNGQVSIQKCYDYNAHRLNQKVSLKLTCFECYALGEALKETVDSAYPNTLVNWDNIKLSNKLLTRLIEAAYTPLKPEKTTHQITFTYNQWWWLWSSIVPLSILMNSDYLAALYKVDELVKK